MAAGEALLNYRVKFQVDDNLDKVLERAKRIQSELGTERGQAGQFGAAIQAAGERARAITTSQGIGGAELAQVLRALQNLVERNITRQGDAGIGYRRAMGDAGYERNILKPPKVNGLDPDKEIRLSGDTEARMQALRLKGEMARQAKLQEVLATDDAYTGLQKRIVAAKGTQQARLLELQNADDAYTQIQKRIAAAKGTQSAKLLESQNADDQYTQVQKRIAQGKATQQAKLLDSQNADDQYARVQKQIAQGKATQQGKLLDLQNADDSYAKAQKQIAQGKAVQQGKLLEQQNADDQYAKAQKRIADGKATQQIKLLEQQNADDEYAKKQKAISQGKATQQAKLLEQQNADDSYAKTQKQVSQGKLEQKAKLLEQQNADDSYVKTQKRIAQGKKQQEADLLRSQNNDPEYQKQTRELARQRAIQKALAAEADAADPEYRAATVRAKLAREQETAGIQEALAADPEYAAATARTKSAREQQTAAMQAELSTDRQYIEATASLNRARQEQAARVALAEQGISDKGLGRRDLLALAATTQRTEADLQAAAAARMALRGDQRSLAAAYEKQAAEAALATELRKRAHVELQARVKTGEAGGTRFQQFQALAAKQGRAPETYQTLGQLATQKTITTAGYAVGGAAVGALMFGTIEAVKEASKLQEQFAGLRGQMESLGQSNAFGAVRERIKEISNETGVAASEVTKFAARLLGVFNDPERALRETESAMKLAVVSGTDLGTMIEELVPVAEQFGTSIDHIGDLAVSIHDKFGIAEEATLHFLGEVAPLAQEAGLSMEEMGVIGATAANSMGKSINVAAEQFSKVLPTMQQNQDKIFQILRSNPETEGVVNDIVDAFGRGEGGEAFKLILQSYHKLDRVQQDNLVRVSGSRREWAMLNGLFANSGKLLDDMAEAEAGVGKNAGGLDRRFEQVSATLSRNLERIQESFKNVIEGLLSSGFGEALGVFGKGLEMIVGVVNLVVGAFNKLNEVVRIPGLDTGPLLSPLVQFAGAAYLANKAYNAFVGIRKSGVAGTVLLSRNEDGLTASITRRTAASQTGEGVLATDTATKRGNAVATGQAAAAEAGLATARGGAGVAGAGAAAANLAGLRTNSAGRLINRSGQFVSPAAAREAIVWNEKLGRYTAGGRMVSNRAAEAAGLFSHLPPPPVGPSAGFGAGLFARSPLATRLAAGGTVLKSGAANAANAAATAAARKAAADAAAAAGADKAAQAAAASAAKVPKTGIGPVAGIALPLIAAVMVKSTIDEHSEKLQQEAGTLREQMKTADEGQLQGISEEYQGFWDDLQEGLFNVDLPGRLAKKELFRRKGERGARAIGAIQSRKMVDQFANTISDERLTEISDELNKNDAMARYAIDELGANVEGNVFDKAGGLARKAAGLATGNKALPFNIGQGKVNVTRENLKQMLPEIKRRAEAGEEGAASTAALIEQEIKNNRSMGEIRQAVDEAIQAGDITKAIEEAGGLDQFLQAKGLYDPEGQLQTGQISRGEYIGIIRQRVADLQRQLAGAPDREKAQKELDQALLRAQQTQDAVNKEQTDMLVRIAQNTSYAPKQDSFRIQISRLKRMSPTAQIAEVPNLYQAQWEGFQEALEQTQSPEEWLRLAEAGMEVDPETRKLAIAKNIKDDTKLSDIARQAGGPGKDQDAFLQSVAEERLRTGKSMREILRERGQNRMRPVGADPANPDLTKFENDLNSLTDDELKILEEDTTNLKDQPKKIQRAYMEKDNAIVEAGIALAASGTTDPYAKARADLETNQARLKMLNDQKEAGIGGPTIDADIQQAQTAVNDSLLTSEQLVHQTQHAMEGWAIVFARGDPVAATAAQLTQANNDIGRLLAENGGNELDPKVIEARQRSTQLQFQQVENLNNITRANMELDAFDRNQDPEQAARDALAMANFNVANAQGDAAKAQALMQVKAAIRQGTDAANEGFLAEMELAAYDRNRDPLQAARDNLERAAVNLGLAQGKGRAAQAQAMIQFKDAQRAIEEAAENDLRSQSDFAIAMATLRQSPVEAAQLAVKEAERRLADARNRNLGTEAIRQATLDLAQKRSDAVDSAVADAEDITNYMLEMGQITVGQAVERLKTERDKYEVNSKKWRDIQLRINSLQKTAQQDSQYNLPANITLPTLYEARRLNQSQAMGIGYLDSRNISLTFNVNGAQDAEAVTNQIVGAMQASLGGGQMFSPGMSVGAMNN